ADAASGVAMKPTTFFMPTMRPSWIKISKGPIGGAPVPSITVAPRRTSFLNGPIPRSRRVAGATGGWPIVLHAKASSSPAGAVANRWSDIDPLPRTSNRASLAAPDGLEPFENQIGERSEVIFTGEDPRRDLE